MKRPPKVHRYQEIADSLRTELSAPSAEQPVRLPSERQLMGRFGVQRNTIRQALAVLESEGRIVTHGKRGTFQVTEEALSTPQLPAVGNVLVINPRNDASTAMSQVVEGLSQAFEGTQLAVLRFDSRPIEGQFTHRMPAPAQLSEGNVVGVVLWPHNPTDGEEFRQLQRAVPLVAIDRRVPGFVCDCVRTDDIAGGRMITKHLIAQGHRRIAFLADDVFTETVHYRWLGYAQALEAAGIPIDPALHVCFFGIKDPPFSAIVKCALEGNGDRVTAVACSNDNVASILLNTLRKEGIRVPQDIAVCGYGDLLPDFTAAMELTSVRQPFVEVGREAGQILLDLIHRKDGGSGEPREVLVPVEVIPRNSSAKA